MVPPKTDIDEFFLFELVQGREFAGRHNASAVSIPQCLIIHVCTTEDSQLTGKMRQRRHLTQNGISRLQWVPQQDSSRLIILRYLKCSGSGALEVVIAVCSMRMI